MSSFADRGDADDADKCYECPAGYKTPKETKRSKSCNLCIPGEHQQQKGKDFCDQCKPGLYDHYDHARLRNVSTVCKQCEYSVKCVFVSSVLKYNISHISDSL